MRRRHRQEAGAIALGLSLCAAATLPALAAPAPVFTAADLAKIVSLGNPVISPDHAHIAVLVRRANLDENKRTGEIDLYDYPSGAHRQITYGREGIDNLEFSPDSTSLAFIANDSGDKDQHGQIYVLTLDGGDPRKVSSFPEGADEFEWRPDGKAFAVVAQESKPKLDGLAKYHDAFEVGNNNYLTRELPRPEHVYLQPLDGSKPTQLTSGDASVTSGEAQSSLSWTPDGTTLLFQQAPDNILNDADSARLMKLNVATQALVPLTGHDKHEYAGAVSPDGSHVAYAWSSGDNQVTLTKPYVTALAGGAGSDAAPELDRMVENVGWRDSHTLLLGANDGTDRRWYLQPLGGAAPQPLDLGGLEPSSGFEDTVARDGTIVFTASSPERPAELYVRSADGVIKRLSDYNEAFTHYALATSKALKFEGPDGFKEDAVVLYPPGFTSGKTYPAVLLIHGGPTSASIRAFDSLGNSLAAKGWIVLEPNYRGSNNLGYAYQHAVYNDVQDGPGRDAMAALDALEKTGVVDTSRIGVSGWSYGGIMTSGLVVKYHVWKAALTGAAVNDWSVDYAVADDLASDKGVFPDSPFVGDQRANYLRQSSITDAKAMTTPLLIVHDVGDARDPIVNSYLFYHALKDNGAPVTFIAYPVNGHFPSDIGHQVDLYQRWIDWFASHF